MTGPRWRIPERWVESTRPAIAAELDRLRSTIRFRLGTAVMAWLRRPWRVVPLARTVLPLLRERGSGFQPLRFPEQAVRLGPGDDVSAEPVRSEVQGEWLTIADLVRAPAFRIGAELVELRQRPWRVLLAPWTILSTLLGPVPAVPRPPPLSGLGVASRHPPDAPIWTISGPPWLESLLAPEGVESVRSGMRTRGLVVGRTAESNPESQAAAVELAREAGARVVLWLLGPSPHEWTDPGLPGFDAVYTDDAHAVPALSVRVSVPVRHLAPAIQPQLQNPTGWWHGPDGRHWPGEVELPADWRLLQRCARGASLDSTELQGVERILGTAIPSPAWPAWAGPEERADRVRFSTLCHVQREETVAQRLAKLGNEQLGLPEPDPPLVSVVLSTRRPERLDAALEAFNRQSYPRLELVLVLHGEGFEQAAVDARLQSIEHPIRLVRAPARWPLGSCLQAGFEAAEGAFLAKMDDDDWYGPRMIENQMIAMRFSNAGVVGKNTIPIHFGRSREMFGMSPGREFCFMELHGGARFLVRRAVHREIPWRPLPVGEDTAFVRDCLTNSVPMYSADRFHFVCHRGAPKHHTWQASRETIFARSEWVVYPAAARPEDFAP